MKRSRSAVVNLVAFFRMRTISGTEPTIAVPTFASSFTSPLLTLALPNLPATKNATDDPFVGTCNVTLGEKAPVVLLRSMIAPPPAVDSPVSWTVTVGPAAPVGFVTRTRHGDGAHVMNRAFALTLLLI